MRLLILCGVLLVACDGSSGPPPDAGPDLRPDAGPTLDAAAHDAGHTPDAAALDASAVDGGLALLDAGAGDAGTPPPSLDERLAALRANTADPDALDELLREVAWAEGWPITDGDRWLFATRWPAPPATVSLVSDVNGWAPAPATAAESGVHFWIVIAASSFEVPAAGAKYKWHGAPDTFRPPPEATAYGYDDFGEFGYVAPPPAERYRERFPDLRSAHLEAPRALRALLPAGFERGDPARVLMMHDGQNIFHPDAIFGGWHVDEAIAPTEYSDVVVLAIDNAPDRVDAYTHVADDIGSGALVGGQAEAYGRLLFEEALPFFRARYGLRADRDDLALAGSSLGGLVSLYLASTHETAMRCVIAMSSTLGWGAFAPSASGADALVRRWDHHGRVSIYLDSGGGGDCADADGDGVFEDSDDSDNYCTTSQLRDRLIDLGYVHGGDLFHHWEPGARHQEPAWAARMPRALSACVTGGWTR